VFFLSQRRAAKLNFREIVATLSEAANAEQHILCEVPGYRRIIPTDAESGDAAD